MGLLDTLRFWDEGKSEVEEEMEKSHSVDRFEVIKVKRASDGTIESKETVMQEPIPVSKEQAEYELGGFEPGFEYRQIAINARGRVMDSQTVRELVGDEALWAEEKGASEYQKELAQIKGEMGKEISEWDKVTQNPQAYVALEAIQDGDYEAAADLFRGEDEGVEADEMEKQIEVAQKLDDTGIGPETMKSAAWLQGFNLFGKVGDPEWLGDVIREATGGGGEQQTTQQQEPEPREKEPEREPRSTDTFEDFVEGSRGEEPTPSPETEPDLESEPEEDEQSFPGPEPEEEPESTTDEIEDLADDFTEEDEEMSQPPEPPEGEAAADGGNEEEEEEDVATISGEVGDEA